MNFCVYEDSGAEVRGYFVPDGFSTSPRIHVRLNGEDAVTEIYTWLLIDGARDQGAHQTGKVGFLLTEGNVPGVSTASALEISDPDSGLVFYRRGQPGQFIPKKVLRLETAYVPHSEIDLSLKPYFQFFAHRVEHYGFETIRQMLEILHQPSIFVSGRILLKSFKNYINYNIDVTAISMRDPFYELAMRLIIFNRMNRESFSFVAPRDTTLFRPVIDWCNGINLLDEVAILQAIRSAQKDALALLSSPFTQQLVATSPTDSVTIDDVSQALDSLSQFTVFDTGSDPKTYPDNIASALGLPPGSIKMRPQLEPVHQLADILRKSGRVEHLLEADLVLYHFIQKAEARAGNGL